jgi:hypothetical protein
VVKEISKDVSKPKLRLYKQLKKERQMLDQLTPQQVEQAFQWLDSPIQSYPPKDLQNLTDLEWFLLDRMLCTLLQEKDTAGFSRRKN